MAHVLMTSEKDIYITNKDGSTYAFYEKGKSILIWDGRGSSNRVWGRFRRMVFKRDNYTCQKCGSTDKKLLRVHHKKSVARFPNLYYDIDNVDTLCNPCHTTISSD